MELADIHSYLKEVQHVSLATLEETAEGFRPRVRTMNFVSHNQNYWLVSYGKDAKVRQLEQNPEFEICVTINHKESLGSIRIKGTAEIIDDLSIKEEIRPSVWFFDRFFSGVEDSELCPNTVEYIRNCLSKPQGQTILSIYSKYVKIGWMLQNTILRI